MFSLVKKMIFNLTKPDELYVYNDEYWVDVSWQKSMLEKCFSTTYQNPFTYRKVEVNRWGFCSLGTTWINVVSELEELE